MNNLKQFLEAQTFSGYLGTLSNTISLGPADEGDVEKLALLLRRPEIGWHTKVAKRGDEWMLTLTINVDRDKLE